MLRRTIYLFLVLVLLGGLGGLIAYYAFDFKPKMIATMIMSSPKPVETVSAADASVEQWQPHVDAVGTLTAVNGIEIAAQVGGMVKELYFDSGDIVKKGQKLIQLDTDTEEAELRNWRVQFENAKSEVERKQAVFKKGFAAEADLQKLTAVRDQFNANIERMEALIAQKAIFAPWDGKLGLRTVAVGKYVAAGDPIIWMQSVDPIYADFTVPESEFGKITQGQKVEARLDAYPDLIFTGDISTFDARVAADSRMITVRARLDNKDGKLLPGMYANVTVLAGTPQQVITVPQTAITYSLYGDSVYAVVPEKDSDPSAAEPKLVVERRIVKTGGVRDGRVEVVSGIKAGERIVIAGQNKIGPGTNVKIDNSIALNLSVDRMTQ